MDGFARDIGQGKLRCVLESAKKEWRLRLDDLTVLSPQNDPYRLDTKAGHRVGRWFGEQVQRFRPHGRIHLRGLHYLISSAGDVLNLTASTTI
jgi:hypothetical protein